MSNIEEQIEDTRNELYTLIKNKKQITNDKELLTISRKLDKLIYEYNSQSAYKIHIKERKLHNE